MIEIILVLNKRMKGENRLMKKRALISAALALIIALAGCSSNQSNSENTASSVEVNKTGLPIVKNQITLDALVCRPAHFGKWSEMKFYKDLEEKTGIKINWQEVLEPYQERINLVFASQDYPDFMFRGATDTQILTAAQTGNILALNDLINEWAPNWKKVIENDSYIKKTISMEDGKIYGLPFIRMDEADYGMRDIMFINKDWLDLLSLSVPETTEDFYAVLKAFKDAKGKELPEDAIPWVMRYNQNVGGHFDIFSSFGIIDNPNHLVVKDGKVVFTVITDEAKEAIKYLHRLYKDELIQQEFFTDDWSAFLAKINSKPSIAGVFSAYNHPFEDESVYVPMLVPRSQNVEKPLMRKQTTMIIRNNAVVFSKNKHPEATMRWLDLLAQEENSVQLLYGTFGDTIEKKDDKYVFIQDGEAKNASNYSSGNFGPAAVTEDIINKIEFTGPEAIRRKYYFDIYKDYTVPLEAMYPNVVYTQQQADLRSQYANDINNYVQEAIADFIVNGNIDARWDDYVLRIKNLGLDKLMEIYQNALDRFNAN
ncbi:MAG: extracellular solute-binding protein [Eubacteriales bacterium]|nr:extracellular solute-binding protein [Eubacteriales bacterium]